MPLTSRGTVSLPSYTEADVSVLDTVDRGQTDTASWTPRPLMPPGTCWVVVGDVMHVRSAGLGTFDFFLDIGCFQGLDARPRLAQGEGASALANPGATLLMLSFGPSRWRWLAGGASQEEIETAFAGWEMLASEPANTAGLGWPMNKTAPRWYRLGRPV